MLERVFRAAALCIPLSELSKSHTLPDARLIYIASIKRPAGASSLPKKENKKETLLTVEGGLLVWLMA